MGAQRKKASSRKITSNKQGNGARRTPKCMAIADRGINTGAEFAKVMSLLIGDIVTERIPARQANAICNACGKLLKVVEMQHKYGGRTAKTKARAGTFTLVPRS